MQNLPLTRTYTFAPADTAAHQFTTVPARLVMIKAPSGNAGTVTILGVGPDGVVDSGGPALAAGEWSPTLWVSNLSQVAYKLSNSADSVAVLVGT